MKIIPCILCGGGGARLWPLSRSDFPKPFVALPGRDAPLIEETYARLAGLDAAALLTVTAAEYVWHCEDAAAKSGVNLPHTIIAEPAPRNTAAALGVAAKFAAGKFGEDAILLVLPADHAIANPAAFRAALQTAAEAASGGARKIALVGIRPAYPATGYGYISCGEEISPGVFTTAQFLEKPNAEDAAKFIQRGDLWNAGIFCFAAGVGLRELEQHAPEIANALPKKLTEENGKVFPSAEEYEKIPAISFDYAVAEKTKNAVVVAADMGWNDIGSWRAVADSLPADADGNRTAGDALLQNCKNTFAFSGGGRLVAAVALQNLHIIDTPDALLVAAADQTEKVRGITDALAQRQEATTPVTVKKPWGNYTVLSEAPGYKVKRLEVLPGAKLSLQSHNRRSEHWTTVEGVMTVHLDGKEFAMPVDQSCHIPLRAKHRMANDTDKPAALIEVQIGDYLEEDDITRYDDIYGRLK